MSRHFFPHIDAPRQVSIFSSQRLLDVRLAYRGNYPLFIHDMLSRILPPCSWKSCLQPRAPGWARDWRKSIKRGAIFRGPFILYSTFIPKTHVMRTLSVYLRHLSMRTAKLDIYSDASDAPILCVRQPRTLSL